MGWIARKVDSLAGAVFATAGAICLSQFQSFVHQYLQRLGGHVDEARQQLEALNAGDRFAGLTDAARELVVSESAARIDQMIQAGDAIRSAGLLARPFAFVTHVERDIVWRTLADFQPALPLDSQSLIYAACGLVFGLLVWELVKLPAALAFRSRRSRHRALARN